jgi:hypothetical protein
MFDTKAGAYPNGPLETSDLNVVISLIFSTSSLMTRPNKLERLSLASLLPSLIFDTKAGLINLFCFLNDDEAK